jgi:hypothetical protein
MRQKTSCQDHTQDFNCTALLAGMTGNNALPCDIGSLKASLSQGREGKWEGKGTPELTDTDLLTCGSGGKGDEIGQ